MRGNIVDKRILIYYEAIDMIYYGKLLIFNSEAFLMTITKINILKFIVILLLLV